MKQSNKYILISIALLIGIAATYLALREQPAGGRSDESVVAESVVDKMSDPASPYLTLSDMKGNAVAMDSDKLIFINVWATWCGPCNAEMPSIETLYERYKDNPKMAFYVVSDEEPTTVLNFLEKKKYQLPFYLYSGAYPEALNGNAIPRTYIVKNGQVLSEQIGAINWNDPQIFKFLDEQLAM